MNLELSVDKLYETGWQPDCGPLSTVLPPGLERLPDRRPYPALLKIQEIFASNGFELAIRYVQLFDCYRAVWSDSTGAAHGAVVGSDEREAAVYALAQHRRNIAAVATAKP